MVWLGLSCIHGKLPALGIRNSFGQHVPNDGCQFSHHSHPGNARSAPTFDPLKPFAQLCVFPQHLTSHLRKEPTCDRAAGFGDTPGPPCLTTVATARRKPPVVGQAVRTRETFYSANTTGERRGRVRTDTRYGRDQNGLSVDNATFAKDLLEFRHAFLCVFQIE